MRRRRVLLILAILLAGLVVGVATVPFWVGSVARSVGKSRGLTFASYERIGYSRFVLRDVEFRRANVRVTATRAEADTPVLWLWRHWRKQDALVVAGDWHVEVERSTRPRDPNAARGWVPLRGLLQRIAVQLDRWLPQANVGSGVVRWPGGELGVGGAKWAKRELVATAVIYRALKSDATLTFAADDVMRLVGRTTDGVLQARLESNGPRVKGEFAVWEQPGTIAANFADRGWLPAELDAQAKEWTISGDRLKLGQLYSAVRGSGQIEWRAGRFVADLTAASTPVPNKPAPPLEVALRGNGDLQAFTIESLKAALPGVNATLSEPVTVERTGKIRESAARFTLQADLAKVPWFTAAGTVSGEARLVSGLTASPEVEFSLDARGVMAREVSLAEVTARGRFGWPRVEIAQGAIVGGAGERLTWRGGWDFRQREVLDGAIEGELRRQSLARWLPKQPEFDAVQLSAQASGPIAELKHEGRARVAALKTQGIHPLATSLQWRGRGVNIDELKAEASAGVSKVTAAGTMDATALKLTALDFVQGNVTRLQLAGPATLRWQPKLQLETLRLTGPEGNLTANATAGEAGRIEIAARNISSKWFGDIMPTPGPELTLTLLALVGAWDQGPMTVLLTVGAGLDLGEGRIAAVNIAARGDRDALRIEAMRATEVGETVVNATGNLPIVFFPGTREPMRIDPKGALKFDATVAPSSGFWQKLAAFTGVELKDPRASAHLTGTWQRPQGNASLQASRIAIDPKRVSRALPAIEELDVQLTADQDGVSLSRCAIKVEGQTVRAQGRLPVPDGQWGALFKEPMAAAKEGADLRVEIPDADVAVFTRFLPAVLAPKGRLQADLTYKNGGVEGFLRLRDAASKPLGPLGVLQEISADIALSGRTLALRGVTAKSGGQPVTLSGTIEVPQAGQPRFDLALRGENLPFVRQTGLLMRGDLDLKLQTLNGPQPRLSGNVRLRDSLFLSDVRAFLPKGGVTNPARRPPYFAIETPPVNAWTLAVEVSGERFIRLRTPVFVGVASARFRLTGTLGEPRAIGEIAIDDGNVRMPFASFAVTQGSVRLTEADPYEPAIYLRGTSRRWGYDLTMEIDGSAAQPNVVFTSSPALDSEQVLLMVMTGIAPSNEIAKSSTQRATSVGLYLGQSLLGSLGTDAADADRLSLVAGEKISRQGKETYDIEYRLSDRWSVIGEYNEFDEYNAGMKWRVLREKRSEENNGDGKK